MSGTVELMAPQWLVLLPGLIVLSLLWRLAGRGESASLALGTKTSRPYFHPLASLLLSNSIRDTTTPWWKMLTFWGAFSAMVLALAQPVHIGKRLPEPPRQRDIVLIVDTSVSMLLRDYVRDGERVKRLDLLKTVLDELVEQLPDDRIGVVVFGSSAHTLVPLTDDHQLVRSQLARLDTDIAGRYAAVGDAVALAVKEAGDRQTGDRRILMLFTDAQLPAGTIAPHAAAELAKESHLQLYTVAIGATSTAAEEKENTGLVYQPANLELLHQLAVQTGAASYHADSSSALKRAVQDIAARKAQPKASKPIYEHRPLYHWPLLVAVLLLLVGQLGPVRRKQ